jgi:regulator of cell morphogenesis and NO signaling
MRVDRSRSVGDLATSVPGAVRVFDDLQIDYGDSGSRSLRDACRLRGLDVGDVVARIERASDVPPSLDDVWRLRPLAALVDHVVSTYHAFTRRELPRLRRLAGRAQDDDGAHPELCAIAALLAEFESEMVPHMVKEERILFPYIVELEARVRAGNRRPLPSFGPLDNPVRAMMRDHHHAEGILAKLRQVTSDYVAPPGAPASIVALYAELEALDDALQEHLHLESNVLFRRAIDLERA